MCSVLAEIESVGGIEEEYFFEGMAMRFSLAAGSITYSVDGRWNAVQTDEESYRTRMLVLRPADPAEFNGSVIVEWNNVSSGEKFLNGTGAAKLLRRGFAVVGVSAQRAGVEGMPEHPMAALGLLSALKTDCPERYKTLHHPGDDYSYDIFTQAAQLLGPERTRDIDPLAGLEVRHLIACGASQSAARLATYINAIHDAANPYDAFLSVVYPNTPCALNHASAPRELPQTSGPNIFDLLGFYEFLLRDDREVPIIVVNSESEASECDPNFQVDTDFIRWWEIAGTGHMGAFAGPLELEEIASLVGGTTVSFAPAVRGGLCALHRWLEGGEAPTPQPRLVKEGEPPRFPRDANGNAIGGIRWPELEAPVATHAAERLGDDGTNVLRGKSTPFSQKRVRNLYPDFLTWLERYRSAVDRLVDSGVILPEDAGEMLAQAENSNLLF
jgi:hypothetical protein